MIRLADTSPIDAILSYGIFIFMIDWIIESSTEAECRAVEGTK